MQNDIPMILEREMGMREDVPALAVGFGLHPIKDKQKSDEAGRAMYKQALFIQIAVPGDKQSLVFRSANDKDKERFPRAYKKFEERETAPAEGTPIETVPWLTRADVLNLKAYNIFTLEMLAEVSDGNAGKLGFNARDLIAKAKGHVAQAKDTAAAQRLAAENQRKDDQIAEMQRQIADLASRLEKPKKAA